MSPLSIEARTMVARASAGSKFSTLNLHKGCCAKPPVHLLLTKKKNKKARLRHQHHSAKAVCTRRRCCCRYSVSGLSCSCDKLSAQPGPARSQGSAKNNCKPLCGQVRFHHPKNKTRLCNTVTTERFHALIFLNRSPTVIIDLEAAP